MSEWSTVDHFFGLGGCVGLCWIPNVLGADFCRVNLAVCNVGFVHSTDRLGLDGWA
jgi:hypothetical protein